MADFEDLTYDGRGPIDWDVLMHVISTVQARLDLVTVLRELFGASLEVSGQRWKTACFLPSAVDSFDGTCAEQDAAGKGNHAQTTNLWVSEGDTTRVWRCHSCERRGDVIDLIAHAEGRPLSTSTSVSLSAVRRGAQLAGVLYMLEQRAPDDRDDASEELVDADAPARIVKPPVQRVEFRRARAINARAAKHWHAMLLAGPGYLARDELKRRGVTDEQAERFVLGCALDKWRDLVDALPHAARDDAQVLGLMGVTRNGKNKGQLYDRYRNRIVWPYCDPARDGRPQSVTGFAGRTLGTDPKSPKWFNSTNTEGVWSKGSALLGLLQAQTLMRKLDTDRITVGEGGWEILAFDRIEAPCVGLVAAPMSADHVHVIATVLQARRITLAGDGDESGRRGIFAGAIAALTYGYALADLDVIDPPDGIDPGKMGETEDGTRALADAYAKPQPLLEFIRAREGIAREQQKRELLAVLPIDVARELAARWGHAFDRADEGAGEALAPAASFAAQLAAAPALAAHLSGAEVRGVFAEDMLTTRQLGAHTFGESTNLHALPPTLRAAWLTCLAEHIDHAISAHGKLDMFAFAGLAGRESFVVWYARDEELRSNRKDARKMLATLQS